MTLRIFTSLLILLAIVLQSEGRNGLDNQLKSVVRTRDGKLEIVDGLQTNAVVWGSFEDAIDKEGWGYLEIRTNRAYDDETAAYAAGAVEATLTRPLVEAHLHNLYSDYCTNNEDYCRRVTEYLQAQLDWMQRRAKEERIESDFWYQVNLILKQLAGLDDVLTNRTLNVSNLFTTVNALYFSNNDGAFYDLEKFFERKPDNRSFSSVPPCSMLIKATSKDVLVGHTTWWVYRGMLRIQKRYSFDFKSSGRNPRRLDGSTIVMPSYPGKVDSLDDFYITSANLVVTETTNNIFNKTLYESLSNETVPSAFRAMVANRLSSNGRQWTRQFSKHNSGTYNNQWSIVDYKKFAVIDGKLEMLNDTFWMLEQLPNRIVIKDMTNVLRQQGYWASYNVPFFPEVYNASGCLDMYKKRGDYYSHENSPRAKIFRRDQFRVEDPASMLTMLRYNDFENDPLSRCNCSPPYSPVSAIAARYDLADPKGTYSDPDVRFRAEGAIDAKVANIDSVNGYQFHAVCGPTSDNLPVFSWSKFKSFKKPMRHPDVFDFKPVIREWSL